ncbi:MAG: hypothetical protein VB122_00950 [Erysipelotrichales bacterium]|nr:hypothetical protein [Erysipelotrichales bacterium]
MKIVEKIAQLIVKKGYVCAYEKSKHRTYEPKPINKKIKGEN